MTFFRGSRPGMAFDLVAKPRRSAATGQMLGRREGVAEAANPASSRGHPHNRVALAFCRLDGGR